MHPNARMWILSITMDKSWLCPLLLCRPSGDGERVHGRVVRVAGALVWVHELPVVLPLCLLDPSENVEMVLLGGHYEFGTSDLCPKIQMRFEASERFGVYLWGRGKWLIE